MSNWIKQNRVLLAGLILPMLLVGLFFGLNKAPVALTSPPTQDFLLVVYQYDDQRPRDFNLSFAVKDAVLRAKVTPHDTNHTLHNGQQASIYRYRAATNRFDAIDYRMPEGIADLVAPVEFAVAETLSLKLDARAESPDGWTFEYLNDADRGGLLLAIFSMGSQHEGRYQLSKKGGIFALPTLEFSQTIRQQDVQFMGWIMKAGKQ